MPKVPRPTRPMADVNVLPQADGSSEIVVCFMPDPDMVTGGEGESKACLCVDASRSMLPVFKPGPFDPNYVEIVARKLGAILCDITKSGKVSMMYWACGPGGEETEEIGEFDAAGCEVADVSGPKQQKWGRGTQLLPAVRYVLDTVAEGADWTMGVILTDGIVEDEAAVVDYCTQLAELIANNQHPPVKLVLIGVGEEVDSEQLERLDSMLEGGPLKGRVDIFSSGQVANMRDEADILGVLFGELIDETTMVDRSGSVLDANGAEIAAYADGVPGKLRFILPAGQTSFTVRLQRGGEIAQDISAALGA